MMMTLKYETHMLSSEKSPFGVGGVSQAFVQYTHLSFAGGVQPANNIK